MEVGIERLLPEGQLTCASTSYFCYFILLPTLSSPPSKALYSEPSFTVGLVHGTVQPLIQAWSLLCDDLGHRFNLTLCIYVNSEPFQQKLNYTHVLNAWKGIELIPYVNSPTPAEIHSVTRKLRSLPLLAGDGVSIFRDFY